MNGICFTDENTGTAVGDFGYILRTTDGGISWTKQQSGTPYHFGGVAFSDANTGTAVTRTGNIIRTTDGGATWTNQTTVVAGLNGVVFTDSNNGYAFGYVNKDNVSGGIIFKTTNGGALWTSQILKGTFTIFGLSFLDANNGFAVVDTIAYGGNSVIMKTTDGAKTWTPLAGAVKNSLMAISFSDINNGIGVGP
ncbi:MAG: WD40/YVTN/BNR-like repeat-containing protein, partial [Bacteroidota bacterium]